ncbi:hypothetical protein, partial [Arthrobacter sp. H35-D1]|uniref:hypothetical protein n=1 Tax=Arthrobacter sp. H35-D1 TaxID=3046202 RepID=UPI0024BAC512
LEILCRAHHLLKHFKDDRTRTGDCRLDQSPERAAVRLRGWTPSMTAQNGVAWTSPRGRYYPPETAEIHAPAYPKWLKKRLTENLNPARPDPQNPQHQQNTQHNPARAAFTEEHGQDCDFEDDCRYDCDYGCDCEGTHTAQQLPEPPPGTFPDDPEFNTMHWDNLIQRGLENPTLGLPK